MREIDATWNPIYTGILVMYQKLTAIEDFDATMQQNLSALQRTTRPQRSAGTRIVSGHRGNDPALQSRHIATETITLRHHTRSLRERHILRNYPGIHYDRGIWSYGCSIE